MSELLNPLAVPLQGSRLIEASAGTGKTWTIAALYLRLVLGHGEPGQAPTKALLPGEILVMTFTKAATRELSDRIRRRLVEAAACFREEALPQDDDEFLKQLLAHYSAGPERAVAAWRLAVAAEAMDDAAVYTIDAWCQRMLREHAFDSGCLFDEELQANQSAMLAEAARDYWRQQIYPLPAAPLAIALGQWKDVSTLVNEVTALLERPLPSGAGQGTLNACIEAVGKQRSEVLSALKMGWGERAGEMLAWLEGQWSRKDCPLDKRSLGQANGTRWIEALSAWAQDPSAEALDLGKGAERLTATGVINAVKPGLSVDVPACFVDFQSLMSALQGLPEVGSALRVHAAACVTVRLQELKTQAGTYGFADMLQRLKVALDDSIDGEKALRLRQRIVDQYPVALIDEFQDTSPVQLGIFDRLYRIETNDPAHALLLIGDPKQSIYGFRGADIYSYLNARRATSGRHYVLGTNHRSTAALVGAVNQLFDSAEYRDGQGAFMFRSGTVAGAEKANRDVSEASGLPFVKVEARGRAERLVMSSGAVPSVTFCLDTELRSTSDSRDLYAALCAERIVSLLNDPGAGFAQSELPLQRLRPADIAVLVRTGTEAAAVRQALRRRGIASVYLSDKDTVFKTDEAIDLLRLFQSVAAPRDVRLARAALATRLLGLTLAELVELSGNDELFDARCDLLRQLNLTWHTQGALAMVRRALHGFGLPARWLVSDDGERRLTNVLHLAELLQVASAQLEGEQALIRWMAQQIEDTVSGHGGDDAQVLRLESDSDLVKVVTVYKSKGLEYPVVFLPFAAHFRAVERKNTQVVFLPDAQGSRTVFLSPTDAQLAAADIERQREDLRLLYVALTRARHSLWVGLSALKMGRGSECVWHRSAVGYLLSGTNQRTPSQLAEDVQALASSDADIEVCAPELGDDASKPRTTRLQLRAASPPLTLAQPYEARFDRIWSISSYSALVRDVSRAAQAGSAEPQTRVLRDDEPTEPDTGAVVRKRAAEVPWHRFPRGAFAGNFLHGLLEWLGGESFALDSSTALQQGLVQRCERQGWGHRATDVAEWLRLVCTTPLPALGVPLAGLTTVMPEMEFWFPSDGLRARAVDELCRHHVLSGRSRPELPERALRGMLMGFADLVFEHDGRYWVLDYKSNALGAQDADYNQAAMEAAMLEHRYDVQAALYLLALHRLLKVRLGIAYVPAQHLGGAIYLFLRGVRSASGGCFRMRPPMGLINGLDAMLTPSDDVLGGEAA